ncbi:MULTISPECIES: HGxxPAAW family protein [unclassified Streptomyces]|uniref:HGxxPAAW family protein n=1 Tax=unclassified Streptomyces TaxID=2593676 RepID=UPI00093EB292|nr:HGxxPAAW family protein [Streptomyces sp. CB02058]OKI95747.1 hypothetical protein AMK10_08685 [Streptomyces sp. CB02058]
MSAHGDADLGHTLAGWTGTALGALGSAVLGAGLVIGSAAVLLAGAVVVAVAVLTCWVLHLAGWGKGSGPRPAAERHWRTRDSAARQGHPGCLGCRMAGRGVGDGRSAPHRAPVQAVGHAAPVVRGAGGPRAAR